ncbi:MAG: type II secretion system protein GspJ [Myxococcota bacterium]
MKRRGFTLLEVLVSVAVISLIAMLIYGSFTGMAKARTNMSVVSDRHQQGRQALSRMAREVAAAYMSAHVTLSSSNTGALRQTGFIGSTDRMNFTAFANRRFRANDAVSDQAEFSYFLSDSPNGGKDLVRRVDTTIDEDLSRGGLIQVLVENVISVQFSYLDPSLNEWQDTWDSTQAAAQLNRLPSQVWIRVEVAGGLRDVPILFSTKATVHVQYPIGFGLVNGGGAPVGRNGGS